MSDAKKKPGHLVYGRTAGLDNKEVLVDTDGSLQIGGTVTGTISGVIAVTPTASVQDTNNSSTTPLAGNATFTGTATDISAYCRAAVLVYSDHDSATGGLKVEFSDDGSSWHDASVFTFVSGNPSPNDGNIFGVGMRARYMRVVYINGSVAQGVFKLATFLQALDVGADILDLATLPTDNLHSVLTKSVIVGRSTAGGGAYAGVKVNPSGALVAAVTAADGDVYVRSGLGIPLYDYSSLAQNSTQDIWTYKTGGSGGTTVATVTITYTDATKVTISTVART